MKCRFGQDSGESAASAAFLYLYPVMTRSSIQKLEMLLVQVTCWIGILNQSGIGAKCKNSGCSCMDALLTFTELSEGGRLNKETVLFIKGTFTKF